MSQKCKISLSYDPTEYYIISIAYSIGQLIYFVCMLELHSYFTLQLAETAEIVYDCVLAYVLILAYVWHINDEENWATFIFHFLVKTCATEKDFIFV